MAMLPSSCDKPSPSSADRLRNNLLNKLGITEAQNVRRFSATVPRNREPSRGSLLGKVQILHEPLKSVPSVDDHAEEPQRHGSSDTLFSALGSIFANHAVNLTTANRPSLASSTPPGSLRSLSEASSSSSSCNSSLFNTTARRRISFNEDVQVIPIPKRNEYSDRIRKHLWESPEEMQTKVYRNSIEFAADGYDARQVLEEDSLVLDPSTGELIHPIHCEIARHIRRQRGLPDAAEIEDLLNTM